MHLISHVLYGFILCVYSLLLFIVCVFTHCHHLAANSGASCASHSQRPNWNWTWTCTARKAPAAFSKVAHVLSAEPAAQSHNCKESKNWGQSKWNISNDFLKHANITHMANQTNKDNIFIHVVVYPERAIREKRLVALSRLQEIMWSFDLRGNWDTGTRFSCGQVVRY